MLKPLPTARNVVDIFKTGNGFIFWNIFIGRIGVD